jgi:hypothetical protein
MRLAWHVHVRTLNWPLRSCTCMARADQLMVHGNNVSVFLFMDATIQHGAT